MNGRLFRIPEYQRGYAWTQRQRNDLFGDIRSVAASGREHFMATIVGLGRDTRTIGADEFKTVELVDGQQRVTTVVILFKALEKALDKRLSVEAKVKRELADLLVKGDSHSLLLLQTNHDSSTIFTDYIRKGVVTHKAVKTASDSNIRDAIADCEKFVSEWGKSNDLVELAGLLRNKLSLIYHELSDEAAVYRVFEVLNSRGLDVKWIDKLKSQLMALIYEHADSSGRAEAIREMQVIWQEIYRVLGLRGDLGDEALRFLGTWLKPDRSNRIVGQEEAFQTAALKAEQNFSSIMDVGRKLKDVTSAVEELNSNVRLNAVTRILHARFVAVAVNLSNYQESDKKEILSLWEKVTFRIFGLGGADSRNKIGDFVRLGYNIYRGKIKTVDVLEELRRIGSDYKIADVVAEKDWSHCYEGWTEELRYLLFRYDESLSQRASERLNASQWNKIWAAEASKSVEHISPQSRGGKYVHSIGNLTMLPPSVNSALQDKPPTEKAKHYIECGLRGTAAVGRLLEKKGKWGKAEILSRSDEIQKFIMKEWSD